MPFRARCGPLLCRKATDLPSTKRKRLSGRNHRAPTLRPASRQTSKDKLHAPPRTLHRRPKPTSQTYATGPRPRPPDQGRASPSAALSGHRRLHASEVAPGHCCSSAVTDPTEARPEPRLAPPPTSDRGKQTIRGSNKLRLPRAYHERQASMATAATRNTEASRRPPLRLTCTRGRRQAWSNPRESRSTDRPLRGASRRINEPPGQAREQLSPSGLLPKQGPHTNTSLRSSGLVPRTQARSTRRSAQRAMPHLPVRL